MDVDTVDLVEDETGRDFNFRSAVIFLMDFRRSMFQKRDDGGYYFKKCVECCKSVMISLARKEHRNWATGIIVMGTEQSKDPTVPKRVAQLQPLESVSVDRIVQLNDMIIENFATAKEKYGQSDEILLSKALHYCQVAFRNWRKDIYNRTIIIFTDDDDPHAFEIEEAHRARKQAEDLRLWNIGLDIVPFGNFDKNKFYKELIMTVKGDIFDNWAQMEENSTVEDIINAVENIVGKFNSHHRFLHLGESRHIAVDIFKPYIEPYSIMKKYDSPFDNEDKVVHITEQENLNETKPSQSTTQDIANKEISPPVSKMKRLHPLVSGRLLKITKHEMITNSARPKVGFTLIGFYPTNDIPEYYSMSAPYLMIPNYKDRENASLFSYLWKRCMDRELCMICWKVHHKSAPPMLVSLTPTQQLAIASGKTSPPGFFVTTLLFLDDLAELNGTETEETKKWAPSEKQREAAEAIVKKLNFTYSPDKFHDYQHRKILAMVEAIALHYDDIEEFDDDTDIDVQSITERLGTLSSEFMDFSHLTDLLPDSSSKRKNETDSSWQRKHPREEKSNRDVIGMIRNQMADKLTVAELRAILQAEGVKSLSTYTKPKLVKLAYERFNKGSQYN